MASRHEIVTIDFRANAAKANPAMRSLQQAAQDLREEIDKTRAAATEAAKNGLPEVELQKFENELLSQMKTLKQYDAAINTLSKGVGTLARAIDAFNAGTLDKMNAAFQKQSFNAAENAKKLLVPGTEGYEKNMAELDALQQKNLENLAKYKLRTEQLLQSIGEGGKISATDLKTEADGLEELMKLLPHLGNEWQDYNQILLRVRDAIKQQADEEKRLTGAIVDANDARERSAQLKKQGAENARQQHEAAKKEADSHTAIIDSLKKEQEEKKKNMADSAAILQQKDKEIESQKKTLAGAETAIKNEKKEIKAREDKIATLKQENETLENTAKTNRETAEQMKSDMKGLADQIKAVNDELEKMATAPTQAAVAAPVAAAPAAPTREVAASNEAAAAKEGETQAVKKKAEADKVEEQAVKNKTKAKKEETQAIEGATAAKEQESKAGEKVTETQKKEADADKSLEEKQKALVRETIDLLAEREKLTKAQEEGIKAVEAEAAAAEKAANAFANLSKEEAEAKLKSMQAVITKGEDGKFSFTNPENAQHFLLESIRSINPNAAQGSTISLGRDDIAKVKAVFKEHYGLESDDDALFAIRGLLSGNHGRLFDMGMINNAFSRADLNTSKVEAYGKVIKDLTDIVNGEVKAIEGESEAKKNLEGINKRLEEVDKRIVDAEKESREIWKQRKNMQSGIVEGIEEETEKTENLNKAQKKRIDLLKQMLETYKGMSKEEAKAEYTALTTKSTVGYKSGKLDMSNPEEVQSWLIGQARLISGKKGSGAISLEKGQVDKLLESFSKRYGWTSDSSKAKDLLKQIIQGGGGLFKSGGFADFSGGNLSVTLKQDNDAIEKRVIKLQTLTAISEGAAEGIEKMTDATKGDTDAVKIWGNEVERRYNAYMELQKKVEEMDAAIQVKRKRKSNLPKEGTDAQIMRRKIDDDIEDYKKKNGYDYTKNQAAALKKSWEGSVKTLTAMMGLPAAEEVKQDTAATNQNTEATERNTKAKRGRKKATQEAADAQKEQNKAEGEAIEQSQQLSADEQKRQELLKKREDLQGQLNEKQEKTNQLEEEAAGADVKRENNLKTITDLQNENINAHTNNEQAYGRAKEKLEELETQQGKNIKKYEEDKAAVEDLSQKIDEHATKRAEANKRAAQTERLTIDAMNDAVKAMEAENRAIDPQSKKWQENTRVIQQYKAEIERLKNLPVMKMMTERMGNLRNLSADALTETKKFWQAMADGAERGSQKLAQAEANVRALSEEERQRRMEIQKPMRERLGNITRLSTADLTETKRYWETMRDGAEMGTAAYKKAGLAVKALNNEEKRRRDNAQAQYINDQMRELNSLSTSGLAEVKRYWQAMADGAKKGSDEAKDAANALKQITEEESKRTRENNVKLADRLIGSRYLTLSESEIRESIAAAREYQQTLSPTEGLYKQISQQIVIAEEHVRKFGVEAERQAQKQAESNRLMRQQLDQGTSLSESALRAQQQYWQRLIDDPKTAKESLAGYRYELERTIELQEQQTSANTQRLAGRLNHPNQFANMSEGELRESIEAGKKLIQTYKSGSVEAETLAKNILAAENHVKQYGVEAQRAAQREAQAVADAAQKRQESDTAMRKQLYNQQNLSESALRAQEQYWRRLIDDPNTASQSLKRYEKDLEHVHQLQEQMARETVRAEGEKALSFFEGGINNASTEDIKQNAAALKKYRDSLPQEDEAETIKKINDYLVQAGAAAEQTAAKAMSMKEALRVGLDARSGNFKGTVEQLTLAKKTLEQLQQQAVKGGLAWRRMQEGIDSINLELQRTGHLSGEVMDILNKPKGKSFNELKQAIEQGRKALASMRTETEEDRKAFDELSKKVKDADFQMRQLGNSSKGTANAFEKAWQRAKTYITFYVSLAAVIQKLVGTMGDLMELSDKMGEVRKTTGFTADEVGYLSDSLKKLDTRTSITGLLDLSVAAGQLGLKTQEDVEGFTIAANKLMVALPEMGKEGATEMLKVALATGEIDKIRKQMEQGIIDGSSATAVAMEKVGSTIDRLRATSAATAPAITDFVKRVGAVGAQSGISIDQVAALGSTVDALGMRVEMSATALSRMIPAIKNNAFEVAKAIGVTPTYLRGLFDEAGGGMKAMLAIFQHIKDQGMGEDDIEKMLGMGNMKEIMKELNQQGARAGIVFSGLSQNVDTLRAHLNTAKTAYEENIAITQEYEKMNETTAAKWERLKNEFEEMFVGDASQRFLGGIIDGIREIVDLLTGPLHGAVTSLIAGYATFKFGVGSAIESALGSIKDFAEGEESIGDKMSDLWDKIKEGNVWDMVASATIAAGVALYEYWDAMMEVERENARFSKELVEEQMKVNDLTKAIGDSKKGMEEANKEVERAKKALDEAKKSTDAQKDSAEKLTKAETDLMEAEEKKNDAIAEHKKLIEQFNTQYGKYLGFMLSEIASDIELANARQLVNDKLRETITLKRKEAALSRIEEKMGGDRDEAYTELSEFVLRKATVKDDKGRDVQSPTQASKVLGAITRAAQQDYKNDKEYENAVKKIFQDFGIKNYEVLLKSAKDYYGEVKDIRDQTILVEEQFAAEESENRKQSQKSLQRQYDSAIKNYDNLQKKYEKATGKAKQQAAADLLKQQDSINEMVENSGNYFEKTDEEEMKSYTTFKKNSEQRVKGMQDSREALLKEAGTAYAARKTVTGETTTALKPTNPWGGNAPAESTEYATWDVNELVARRNQMDKFKNILKPDTDIRAVLAEDKALMKALSNGLKEDWKSVLDWYNTERKKIQDELKSERFSTNEGHWRDEKQSKSRKNHFRESDYALAELDRYYSKRKEQLEEARIKENMSEELFNRQAELLEQEHLERRSKLRDTFTAGNTKAEKEMVKQFRDWWKQMEKEGNLDNVPWATVESEWAKALASEIGRNNLKAQQDLTQMEQITVKHLNAIAKIIEKERPYDGIVANLRKNLTDMDVLLADVQKNGPAEDPALLIKEQTARLQFLLGEAETAYQSSIDDVLKRMADAGMTAWAEEISKSDAMKNALMAQLQTAYDEIQNAIKKEASMIKKHADIWWNDLMPGQDTSRKGGFEKMLTRLGLQEDQVKRANALIGAGSASERVADKLAIKQMQIRLQMQQVYYQKMRQMWDDRIRSLREQGKEIDAQHAEISKQLSLSEEQKKLDEQRVAIANQLEESQNRLYTQLREWGDLLSSSMRDLMEASNAGNAEYYNELAKLNLTGKGGPGAGTYIVIENEGTEDARAHYEFLDERAALERQREIERQNAQAEAWKKVMDDLNAKMNEQITDMMNAALQNAATEANTNAVNLNNVALDANTQAIGGLAEQLAQGINVNNGGATQEEQTGTATEESLFGTTLNTGERALFGGETASPEVVSPAEAFQAKIEASNNATNVVLDNLDKEVKATKDANKTEAASTQSAFAKMVASCNMFGLAYQTMSNDNLDASQKFQMFALQAAGQTAIGMLTANLAQTQGQAAIELPGILGKAASQLGPIAGPIAFAAMTALLGGLMGMAVSKVAKSKSQISQVTGASASAGRLATGMLTYAEGNVNEMTDPKTLTVGRQYNVDGADGRTYRARYMGKDAKTHITNGPEFHLVGEKGREAIIDAHTTRNIQMNEPEIWHAIKTLYNGGSLRHTQSRRGRGVKAFAEGNMEDYEDVLDGGTAEGMGAGGMGFDQELMAGFRQSLDRNNELLERALSEGIKGVFGIHGKGGIVDAYDTGKKEALRHGERN